LPLTNRKKLCAVGFASAGGQFGGKKFGKLPLSACPFDFFPMADYYRVAVQTILVTPSLHRKLFSCWFKSTYPDFATCLTFTA